MKNIMIEPKKKRGQSAYNAFISRYYEEHKGKGLQIGSKEVSEQWKHMSAEEKEEFEKEAKENNKKNGIEPTKEKKTKEKKERDGKVDDAKEESKNEEEEEVDDMVTHTHGTSDDESQRSAPSVKTVVRAAKPVALVVLKDKFEGKKPETSKVEKQKKEESKKEVQKKEATKKKAKEPELEESPRKAVEVPPPAKKKPSSKEKAEAKKPVRAVKRVVREEEEDSDK